MDVDLKHDIFTEHNWQYVLYGMGFKTDIGPRAGALRFFDDAKAEFADIARQSDYALTVMPKHRDLIDQVRRHGFMPQKPAQPGRRYA
jgi:tryptophan halogenase